MKRSKKTIFEVFCAGQRIRAFKRTAGAAAREAFKILIAGGVLKHQPASNSDGGWDGVAISP